MSRFESAAESLSPTDRPGLESLLIEASKFLHPSHHVCVDLKFSLAQLYGRDRPQDQRLLMEEGERKKRICLGMETNEISNFLFLWTGLTIRNRWLAFAFLGTEPF